MTESAPQPRARIESVDVVRGVIMIVMALDHVRDYLGARSSPTNLATTTVALVAVAVSAIEFGTIRGMFESPTMAQYPVTFPPGWGFALPGVYLSWIGIVAAVYPLCRWFAALKQRRRDWWLSYL